jgi:Golgi nucleoside diphosphatase
MERAKESSLESPLTTSSTPIPSGNRRVPEKKSTFAVLDLRSGSTRVFSGPTFYEKQPDSALKDVERKYDLTFGGEKRVLCPRSYLGYGLKQAASTCSSSFWLRNTRIPTRSG